jgi:DNA-directed RNA polymerase subunit beta'
MATTMLEPKEQPQGRPDFEIRDINKIKAIRIGLASPEVIRGWSSGEVKNPETIDYKTHKPKTDGLFCERIFGPHKDYECSCGKFVGIKHKGVTCDRCGVEVIQSKVRRSRLGHIELEMPVAHIWFAKGVPSRMANLLDVSLRSLEKVIYYEEYIVIDPGDTPLEQYSMLSEVDYHKATDEYGESFIAKMGAEAVEEILVSLDMESLAKELRFIIGDARSKQKIKKAIKRLKVVEDFRHSGNRPEWMILHMLPVLPPDLRPLVPLDGGRFATSDLNDLYRRVINRNNRLRRLKEVKAPEVIIRNEKRMLQEAVDALLDNGRRGRPVKGSNNRPLKSLADMLKGKQGRFRQNLLGKRVDYSGRSVIVVGPDLRFDSCGLPKKMALELFEPFIIHHLELLDDVNTIRSAKRKIEREDPEVFDVLEEVIKGHPVLLNRAPTLHRLGIQAFYPVLVEGKAIRLHPLVCSAFNSDFDGDQMAVHLPLSREAIEESKQLMLSSNNILKPSSGEPVATPSQDIVMGCYYMTKQRPSLNTGRRIKRFSSCREAITAFEHKAIHLQEDIEVRLEDDFLGDATKGVRIRTTVGRVIFNEALLPELRFVNQLMNKKQLSRIISNAYRICGQKKTVVILDHLKDLGFMQAKLAGVSISVTDMVVPKEKPGMLEEAHRDVKEVISQFERGLITDTERYNKVIDRWITTTDEVENTMRKELSTDQEGFNPVYIMADSGARGSYSQIKQLAGMRGLMSKPMKKMTGGVGEIIESPITANLREGLTVLEYFISTHGARKGLADTALKTAEAGYLTRRLVDVAQDVIITEYDCGTISGVDVTAIKEGDDMIEPLQDRVRGRVVAEDIINPLSGQIIVKMGDMIGDVEASTIERCGVDKVRIRSVMSCESKVGMCAKCYGRDLSNNQMVRLGEAVGVIAAQSIGEPGTQLTLRTFHIGGTASRIVEQSEARIAVSTPSNPAGLREGEIGCIKYFGLQTVVNRSGQRVVIANGARPVIGRAGCKVSLLKKGETGSLRLDGILIEPRAKKGEWVVMSHGGRLMVRNSKNKVVQEFFDIPKGAVLYFNNNDKVKQDDLLIRWFPFNVPLLAPAEGTLKYCNIEQGVNAREYTRDEKNKEKTLQVSSEKNSPHAEITSEDGTVVKVPILPGYFISQKDGDKVLKGTSLARINIPIVTEYEGKCRLIDIEDGITIRRELNPVTNNLLTIITEHPPEKRPRVRLVDRRGDVLNEYYLPEGAHLNVEDGEDVFISHKLAGTVKIVQEFHWLGTGLPLGAAINIENLATVLCKDGSIYLESSDGSLVPENVLSRWDPYFKAEIASRKSHCRFSQLELGKTLRDQRDPDTDRIQYIVIEHKGDLHPAVELVVGADENGEGGKVVETHPLSSGATLVVKDGEEIAPGDILARIPKETAKSTDVTGGLPRVEEIFEARRPKPKNLAVVSKLDGWVHIPKPGEVTPEMEKVLGKRRKKGTRIICICNREGQILDGYEVEVGKFLLVRDGDWVATGEKLVDGSIDPHEYLDVMGEKATYEYLLNEVQEVYRLQGVEINDKHIEVIVRQMMRKVMIVDPGDTSFLHEEQVDRARVIEANNVVEVENGQPARYQAKLLGITKASLGTESFISAASFQETTRVLTQAAISGKIDNLVGLKENVIMGHLIPAGTGKVRYLPGRVDMPEPGQPITDRKKVDGPEPTLAGKHASAPESFIGG